MGSVSAWDLRCVTLEDEKEVEALTYVRRGVSDVGAISRLVQLRQLSLAFNQLRQLGPLAELQRLEQLDLSHNSLTTVAGLEALSCLTALNLGCNKLSSVGPVCCLPRLGQLCLHSNHIAEAGAVQELSSLRQLRRLSLAGNPVNNQLTDWKKATRSILPDLEVLDTWVIKAWPEGGESASTASAATQESSPPGLADSWQQLAEQQRAEEAAAVAAMAERQRQAQQQQQDKPQSSSKEQMSFQDVSGMLPAIEKPVLKPRSLPPPPEPARRASSSSSGGSGSEPGSGKAVTRDVQVLKYPNGSQGAVIRSDGSALVFWPSGAVAATLDPEDAVTTNKYRLLAMYCPSANVAATFDSAGGFLQHSSGALMLVWNRKDGLGSLYDAEGSLQARWARQQAKTMKDMTAVLSPHMRAVFKPPTGELLLTFTCEGVQLTLSSMQGAVVGPAAATTPRGWPSPAPPPPPAAAATGGIGASGSDRNAAQCAGDAPKHHQGAPTTSSEAADVQALLQRARALMSEDATVDEQD